MKNFAIAVVSFALAAVALSPTTRADQWDKRTILTVNEAIQVPTKVLPPGTYVMKLLNSPSDRHIVQIYNSAENHLETTVLAIPNYRVRPTDKPVLTFWETPQGQPKALRAWFYPGDNFGQEFAYPKSAAVQIAAVSRTEVPIAEPARPAELPAEPVTIAAPPAQEPPVEQEVAQNNTQAPPQAEPAPAPPEPVSQPVDQDLPKTASPYPLIGLSGLLSLGLFGLVRAVRLS
jgi:hypothetical protein